MAATKKSLLSWYNTVAGVDGLPAETKYYYERGASSGNPDEDDAVFYGLSPEQKIALSSTTKPTTPNGYEQNPLSGTGSAKLGSLYIARNPDNTLSFYATGTGDLFITLTAVGSTPVYSGAAKKKMTTADGPYPRPGLFPGSLPYGSLLKDVFDGRYKVKWEDEDGKFLTFGTTLTKVLPVHILASGIITGGGTNPPIPTPTPIDEQNYTSKGTLGGYVTA